MSRVMRFTAAAIPTVLTLDRSESEALKRREAATSATASPSPLHHAGTATTPPVAACALPSSTNAVTPWKQEGIPLGKVRHPLDLPLLDPKYSNNGIS